jgi:hypothetical protein
VPLIGDRAGEPGTNDMVLIGEIAVILLSVLLWLLSARHVLTEKVMSRRDGHSNDTLMHFSVVLPYDRMCHCQPSLVGWMCWYVGSKNH